MQISKFAVMAVLGLAALSNGANAQTASTQPQQAYPSHQITMIVPFAAGGPSDVIARIVADNMGKSLGQTFVIENVVGAGGTTGSTRAMRAAPDGYTIEMGHMGTHGAAPALYPGLKYDPTTLEAVGMAASTPTPRTMSCAVSATGRPTYSWRRR